MMDHSLMQTSRSSPNPTPSLLEDSWYTSRLPVSGAVSSDQMIAEIKMRNRRYQQSVAGTEQTRPMMMKQPQQMMTEEMMMMTNLAYTDLQRQVHMLQAPPTAPLQAPRLNVDDDALTLDSLPAPRKVIPKKEKTDSAVPAVSVRGVPTSDQIAIRSFVLGNTL